MPRNRKNRKLSTARVVTRVQSTLVPFRAWLNWAPATATSGFLSLVAGSFTAGGSTAPTLSEGRLASIAPLWAYFRFKKLRWRIFPTGSSQSVCVVCYVPTGIDTAAPATLTDAISTLPNAYQVSGMTVPSKWADVPEAILRGQFPRYRTVVASTEPETSTQGFMYLYSNTGASASFNIIIEGEVEYSGPVDATVALNARRDIVMEEIKSEYILVPKTSVSVPPTSVSSSQIPFSK